MLNTILFFLPPYLIGFVLIAFLPNWRWLLIAFGATFSLVVWAYNDVIRSDGNGLAIVAGALSIFAAGLGLLAGLLARGVVLIGRAQSWRLVGMPIVHPIVFLSLPMVLVGWVSLQNVQREARLAEPAEDCASELHRAALGEVALALPISRAIKVGAGFEFDPSWMFEINNHARDFCREAQHAPPPLTNIHVDLGVRTSMQSSQLYESAFCRSQQPYAWWASACQREGHEPSRGFPDQTTVYVIDQYNAAKMHAWAVEDTTWARQEMMTLPQTRLAGAVAYIGEHQRYFTLDAQPEFLARCHATTTPGAAELACVGGQPIGAGLGLIIQFLADQKTFAADAEQAFAQALEIFESLKAH